jgi:hypothetical protein
MFISTGARAAFTGDELKALCDAGKAACDAYILGVADGINLEQAWWDAPRIYCFPEHVTFGQAAAVVKKYLQDHPEYVRRQAAELVALSLSYTFPCESE